jgi:hypothetical protein
VDLRKKRPALQKRRRGARPHGGAVGEAALVEEAGGEGAHVRVHAILLGQHQRGNTHLLCDTPIVLYGSSPRSCERHAR